MAQLKDLLVSGPSRLIGKLFANEAQLTTLNIPTTSGGTTYGPGTNNQVLTSNGTTVYWASGFSGNANTATALTSNAGSGTQPIYFSGGKPVATTYALNATVNSSTATYMTYYSGANAVSGTSNARIVDGALQLWPSSGSYREGLRIYPTGSWATIMLGGNDLTAASGTSANSWSIHNNNGGFYIGKNGSNTATIKLQNASNQWEFVGSTLKITNNSNTVNIGSQNANFTHIYNTADIPFIFNKSVLTTAGNLGDTTYPFNNLYIGKTGAKGIYYVGTKATTQMITFVDNTADVNGNGIKIGGGGVVVVGSGEASSNLSVNGGDEVLYLLSDGALNVEANAQTIANRLGFQVTTAGAIIPVKAEAANNNVQNIGASDNKWNTVYASTFSGNAATATKFASAQSVTLTGDVTGTASSQAGWSIATTLANSGVTASSYGPSANASPAHGGTFSVPYITVDAKGRITAASSKTITLPASGNTDTLVTQTNTTGDASYRLLLSENANDTTETKTARKSTKLQFNPSSGKLTLSGGAHINQAYTGTATAAANNSGTYTPAKWTFNLGFNPVTGDTIIIKVPGAGHDYGVFLSTDNGANYHPIRIWASNSRLTTHYAAGSYIELTYDSTQVTDYVYAAGGATARSNITGSWNVVSYYDANTTRVWNLYKCYGNYTANNAIKRYQILFQGLRPNEKKLIALYETDNNTATGKTLLTSTEFDPLGEIFYYNSTGAYVTGNTIDAGRLDWTALADLRYTFNITNDSSIAETTAFRGTAPNPLYLRVTINSTTGGAKVDTNQPLTSTLPTTADGKYYIYLGNVYDWYRVYLNRDHPVYFHNGTKLTEYKGNTTTTNQLVLTGSTNATMTAASTNPKITFMENANTQPVHLIYTDQDSYRSPAGLKIIGGTSATPAWLETEGSYYATGTSTGQSYYILGNGVEYGRWWLNTIGKAGTATTYTNPDNSSQTITGYTGNVTGNIYLSIGNNKAVGTNGSSYSSPGTAGTANNAQGYLRLYGSGTTYGEMTGYGNYIYPTNGIAFPENKVALNFRPGSSSYYSHFSHQTSGNEALVMATQNAVTSFIFVNGESLSNIAPDRWTKLTGASGAGNAPGLQIKNNCVSIGKLIPNNTTPTYKLEVAGGIACFDNGLELKGHIAGDAGTTGHGLYSGGGYHNAYNNLILHGDASTGSSGIAFVSDKATAGTGTITNVNAPSDRAFIQYHACGITTATAENTNPTLATSGEAGRLVIGIGNDAADQVWLQTPSRTGLIHQVAADSYVIPDTGNTTGSVGGVNGPVYVDGGVIKACTAYADATVASATSATKAGAASITTTKNAVAYYTNTTGSFGSKASANGALYATSANGDLNWGTLPVGQGGTGKTSWTQWGVVYASASSTLSNTAAGAANTALMGKGSAAPAFVSVSPSCAWTGGTTAGPTLKVTVLGVTQSTGAAIPSASASASGIITTGAQTIAGAKTLLTTLTINGLKGTSNTDYGTTLPSSGTEGQIFFQISNETYEIPAGGTTGQALIKNSNTDRDVKWGPVGGQQTPNNSAKFYPSGSTSTTANTGDAVFNTSVYVQNSVLFGAAWNDYAEYRETTTPVEAGRVVIENGDDTLSLSTERMQPGAEIVSDTFGFAIGQTEKSKTAIAATGRVLAYPHEPRRTYRPGQPVCSGPNGTVSQMTDEEARMYPWCIIGTVSSIPEYDTWGEDNIKVDGRIWVRIR